MTRLKYEHILIEHKKGGVAVITINRPQKMNAFASQTRREMAAAFNELGADPKVGAIILTGAGDRAFAAGQDLAEAQKYDSSQVNQWIEEWTDLYAALLKQDKPVIAAVNGYAVGAAFQIALLCDLRICSETARFGMPEIEDAIPCITGTWTLWDAVGRLRTADMILTGRIIDAQEALVWGIARSVVPKEKLMEAALELGRTMATKPKVAMRLNKTRLRDLLMANKEESAAFAKRAHTEAYASGEPQTAMANFLAKRAQGRSH